MALRALPPLQQSICNLSLSLLTLIVTVMNNYIVQYLYMFYVTLLYVYVVTWSLRIVI
jgi:hypothetical protein